MHSIRIIIFSILLAVSGAVFALNIQQVKQQGLAGETDKGYVVAIKTPSKDIKELIDSVNAKRKEQYEKLAPQASMSLADFGRYAGKKAIEKTPAGQRVQIKGKWVVKK